MCAVALAPEVAEALGVDALDVVAGQGRVGQQAEHRVLRLVLPRHRPSVAATYDGAELYPFDICQSSTVRAATPHARSTTSIVQSPTRGRLKASKRCSAQSREALMGFMDDAKKMADDAATKAKQVAADAKEKSGPALDKAKATAGEWTDKAKVKAGELGEKAKPADRQGQGRRGRDHREGEEAGRGADREGQDAGPGVPREGQEAGRRAAREGPEAGRRAARQGEGQGQLSPLRSE